MWNNEIVELLIIKYQEHDNLYNVRNPTYMDRVKRSNSLFSICQELKSLNKDITVEAIKKKIHTLRAQFIKETREIANSKRSGVGAEDVYVPKLWCFSHLQFLKSHCTLRKSVSNISEVNKRNTSFEEDDEPAVVITEKIALPSCNKRKKTVELEERINNVKKLIISRADQKSCYDWLGKEVVFEINKIKNEDIQREVVWKIQQMLRQASLEDKQSGPKPSSSFFTSTTQLSFKPIQPHNIVSTPENLIKNMYVSHK